MERGQISAIFLRLGAPSIRLALAIRSVNMTRKETRHTGNGDLDQFERVARWQLREYSFGKTTIKGSLLSYHV
jgi:hypothetical protein